MLAAVDAVFSATTMNSTTKASQAAQLNTEILIEEQIKQSTDTTNTAAVTRTISTGGREAQSRSNAVENVGKLLLELKELLKNPRCSDERKALVYKMAFDHLRMIQNEETAGMTFENLMEMTFMVCGNDPGTGVTHKALARIVDCPDSKLYFIEQLILAFPFLDKSQAIAIWSKAICTNVSQIKPGTLNFGMKSIRHDAGRLVQEIFDLAVRVQADSNGEEILHFIGCGKFSDFLCQKEFKSWEMLAQNFTMTPITVVGENRSQIIFVDSSTRDVLANVSASFQVHPKSMPSKGVKVQQVKIDAATLCYNVNKNWCGDDIVVEMKLEGDC
jgi:hypothetical protein